MSQLIIISGTSGTGKTAVTSHLARTLPRGCRIEGDQLYCFVAQDYRSPLDDGGGACGALFRRNMIAVARNFLADKRPLVINHVFTPAVVLELCTALDLTGVELRVVYLRASLAELLARDARKREPEGRASVETCLAWFETLVAPPRFTLETGPLTVEAVAAAILGETRFVTTRDELAATLG